MSPKTIMFVLVASILAVQAVWVTPKAKKVDHSKDCFMKKRISFGQFQHEAAVTGKTPLPGTTGLNLSTIEPYGTVFKDGFMRHSCFQDSMYYRGDHFGDNKHDYALADRSNVSIISYLRHVPKEDQQPMSSGVCFDFCRTMKDMLFFGLIHGRECYCTPYIQREAGDSSDCDDVCEGDSSTVCGGATKSSIFEMHNCNDAQLVLARAAVDGRNHEGALRAEGARGMYEAGVMQALAAGYQESFGKAGDVGAADLMQQSKVRAGILLHASEAADDIVDKLDELLDEVKTITGIDYEAIETGGEKITVDKSKAMDDLFVKSMVMKPKDFAKFENAKKANDLEQELKKFGRKADDQYNTIVALTLESCPQVSMNFQVTSGNCHVDSKNCVTSPNFDTKSDYDNYGDCDIDVLDNYVHGANITVSEFKTESCCDALVVNGQEWYGNGPPDMDGTLAKGQILWRVDSSVTYKGWKICGLETKKDLSAAQQYYPAMYFVDKEFENAPSTCTGDLVGEPLLLDYITCSFQCDSHIQNCVGFSFFPGVFGKDDSTHNRGLCFLFSKLKTINYYTGSSNATAAAPTFLSLSRGNHNVTAAAPIKGGDPDRAVCVAKLSEFVNVNIKPNPSGKCDVCLKEANKLDRDVPEPVSGTDWAKKGKGGKR